MTIEDFLSECRALCDRGRTNAAAKGSKIVERCGRLLDIVEKLREQRDGWLFDRDPDYTNESLEQFRIDDDEELDAIARGNS